MFIVLYEHGCCCNNNNLQMWPCTWPFEPAEEKVYFLRGLLEWLRDEKCKR